MAKEWLAVIISCVALLGVTIGYHTAIEVAHDARATAETELYLSRQENQKLIREIELWRSFTVDLRHRMAAHQIEVPPVPTATEEED